VIFFPKTAQENAFLKAWLEKRIEGVRAGTDAWCLGVWRSDKLAAVAAFTNYRTVDIEILFASDNPRWATKQTIAWILAFPFVQLKTQRCSAMVLKSNKRVRKLLIGIGFKEEGRHLHAAKNLETILSYGMTRAYYLERYGVKLEQKVTAETAQSA
jgi:hypothetical protein